MLRVENPLNGWQPPTARETARITREESEEALGELAGHLRAQAAVTPGWEAYADKLGVHADGGETYVGLPPGDEDEQAAFDLEYGTSDQAPTALLRNTLTQHGPQIQRRLGQALQRRVLG